MEYTSTLDTLEGFWRALARHYKHEVGGWAILFPLAKVRESQELLMVVNKAPSSLLGDSLSVPYIDGIHDYSRYP